MENHPIEGLMQTAMESIKEMVDVNTVVGDPVETPDGSVIVPVSRVSCGFAAGGGEYDAGIIKENKDKEENKELPFGGGSGAGVSVQPVGFLVVGNNQVRFLPVDGNAIVERLVDITPQVISQVKSMFNNKNNGQNTSNTQSSKDPKQ